MHRPHRAVGRRAAARRRGARAGHATALVLADEPTGNLDGGNAEQVFELMLELNRERRPASIVVTHDLRLAARMDRVLELEGGNLRRTTADYAGVDAARRARYLLRTL